MKCKYLEHQICTRSAGQYRLCCTSFDPDNKEPIYTHTPQQWHDSDFHRGVREQLDRDEWPDACIKCKEAEEKGHVWYGNVRQYGPKNKGISGKIK